MLHFRISEASLKSQPFYVKFTTQLSPKVFFVVLFFLQNVQAHLHLSPKRWKRCFVCFEPLTSVQMWNFVATVDDFLNFSRKEGSWKCSSFGAKQRKKVNTFSCRISSSCTKDEKRNLLWAVKSLGTWKSSSIVENQLSKCGCFLATVLLLQLETRNSEKVKRSKFRFYFLSQILCLTFFSLRENFYHEKRNLNSNV